MHQEIRVRHEFSDGNATVDATLVGRGLRHLPTWLIGDHLRCGTLVPVLEQFASGEMPIHAVWPRLRYVQPELRVVFDALAAAAEVPESGFNP